MSFYSSYHALSKSVKIFENFYFIIEILSSMCSDLGKLLIMNLIYYEANFAKLI
jgi:hypothetical protein